MGMLGMDKDDLKIAAGSLALAVGGAFALMDHFKDVDEANQENPEYAATAPTPTHTGDTQNQYVAQWSGEEVVIVDIDQEAMIDDANVIEVSEKSVIAKIYDSVVNSDSTKGEVSFTVGDSPEIMTAAIVEPLTFEQ